MKTFIIRCLVPLLVLCVTTTTASAGEFFWSSRGFGENAVPGSVSVGFGGAREVFLYYRLDGQDIDTSLSFDVELDNSFFFGIGSFQIIDAEIFNFDVVLAAAPTVSIGKRWESIKQPVFEDGEMATGFSATNRSSGFGLSFSTRGNAVFMDSGFDKSANAFLIGSITLKRKTMRDANVSIENFVAKNSGEQVNPNFNSFELDFAGCLLATINGGFARSAIVLDMEECGRYDRVSSAGGVDDIGEPEVEDTANTIWYQIVPDTDGIFTCSTFGTDIYGAALDTQLHIFTGFESSLEDLILVTNNNDHDGTVFSRVSFPVKSGQRYEVRVGAAIDEMGQFQDDGCAVIAYEFIEGATFGDANCDGFVNLLDVADFVAMLSDGTYKPTADMNFDGCINLLDVQGFIDAISGN